MVVRVLSVFWRDMGCGGGGHMCGKDAMIGGEQHRRTKGEDTMAEPS